MAPTAIDIERLIEYMWPGEVPKSARSMVHIHVSAIRTALGDTIVTDGSTYRLHPDVLLTVDAFSSEVDRAVREQHRAPAVALDLAARAIGRVRGRALPELDDHPHGRAVATTIDGRRRRVVEVWVRSMIAAHRAAETIEQLDSAIADEPLHEPYRELQMRARYAVGDHVGAVRSFTEYRKFLAAETGLEPGPALVDLERRLLLHTATDEASLADDEVLGPAGAPLVGRDAELDAVLTTLADRRLVTVLGPPGMGKTRLAQEVALVRRRSGDRVRAISLVGQTDPSHVREEVTRVVTERGRSGATPPTSSTLIVIDNADQHTAVLRRLLPKLLAADERVSALVTSRTRIGCRGECRIVLAPFRVPDDGIDLDAFVANPAVQLFVDSVRAVAPRFRLTADNIDHVRAAVIQADGVPLSIELAAAWVPSVGVARLGQVETGPRSLTETIADNLLTLDPVELSVMQAAASVARWFDIAMLHALLPTIEDASSGLAADPITAAVRSLLDRSLIESDHRSDGRVRHRLLEPVREAVLARSDSRARATATRQHRTVIRAHAHTTFEGTGTSDEPRRFREVDELFDDYRAAMSNAIDDDDVEAAVEIASSIWRYWFARFRVAEGVALLRRADAAGGDGLDPIGARTLGWLLYMGGAHADAHVALERAVTLAIGKGEDDVVIRCRLDQAQLATGQGKPDEALRHLADARGRLSRHAWPWADAVLHCRTGAAFAELGRVDDALHHLDLAAVELESAGDQRELGLALALRSHMHRLRGNADAATKDALAAQHAARTLHDEPLGCTAGIALALALAAGGDTRGAAQAVAQVAIVLPHHSAVDVCQLVLAGAAVAESAGELDRAERWVAWCHGAYVAAGVRRSPRLQADVADRLRRDGPAVHAAPSALAAEVVDLVGSVAEHWAPGAGLTEDV